MHMSCLFFFKQKTAYEMRISDWSSDVCSSDLRVTWKSAFLPTISDCTVSAVSRSRLTDSSSSRRALEARKRNWNRNGGEHSWSPSNSDCDTKQIGRASCRERVCQYVYISVVDVSLKKKKTQERTENRVI